MGDDDLDLACAFCCALENDVANDNGAAPDPREYGEGWAGVGWYREMVEGRVRFAVVPVVDVVDVNPRELALAKSPDLF